MILTRLEDVRVVIIGQDPYPTPNVANGLAFSVSEHWKGHFPRSLVNIYTEMREDIGCDFPKTGDLSRWAKQGILLLNTHLTVEPYKPMSHSGIGWKALTTEIVHTVREENPMAVFVLWGQEAQKFVGDTGKNPKVLSAHPSPLSAEKGFFHSRPFTKIGALLQSTHQGVIDWR